MHWKRFAHAFLLGLGFSVLGVGCAAVNALVSSPAGSGADPSSPQRLAAIGRVFENQGRYTQATAMYRRALKVDPGNSVAQDRLQYIASRRADRTFNGTEQQTQQALAVADSIGTRQAPSGRTQRAAQRQSVGRGAQVPPVNVAASQRPVDIQTALNNDSVISSLTPIEIKDGTHQDDRVRVDIADTDFELAGRVDVADSSPPTQELGFAPADQRFPAPTITTVGFADDAATDSAWKSSNGAVRLEAIMEWLNTPGDFEGELIEALTQGEDEGVQALAASALAECSSSSSVVDDALEYAWSGDSALVAVTALESLVLRGTLTENGVGQLLSMAQSSDAEIRSQAAGSLRHLAGSQWSTNCVIGLCDLLADNDPATVAMAASTLGDFGVEAADCRDDLRAALNATRNTFTREAIEHALSRIPAGLGSQDLTQDSPTLEPVGTRTLLPIVE